MQIVSCAKCRYQYELISGDIVSIESEEIRLVPSDLFVDYNLCNLFSILLVLLFLFVIMIASIYLFKRYKIDLVS